MVSPRKSRRKSACFSRTRTSMPARARRKASIMPAGPPPTMQQRVCSGAGVTGRFSEKKRRNGRLIFLRIEGRWGVGRKFHKRDPQELKPEEYDFASITARLKP